MRVRNYEYLKPKDEYEEKVNNLRRVLGLPEKDYRSTDNNKLKVFAKCEHC
jgi:hypothetical protein